MPEAASAVSSMITASVIRGIDVVHTCKVRSSWTIWMERWLIKH